MTTGKTPHGSTVRSELIDEPSPRAFAISVGLWFMIAGGVFALSGCLFCTFGGWTVPKQPQLDQSWTWYLRGENWPFALIAINLATAFVGGLALLSAGIGLRAERSSSATVALVTSAIMAMIDAASCVLLIANSQWFAGVVYAVVALINAVLFLLATGCRATFRQYPPPEQNVVSDAWLDEHRSKRRRSLDEIVTTENGEQRDQP